MIKLSDHYQCSGCAACADVCPVKCIEYRHDALGYLYPVVDAEACVGCGACDRVCPIKPENVSSREPDACLAAWSRDEAIHTSSSSGGMGYQLAREILRNGGVVYGCSSEDPHHVCHIRVDNEAKLSLLQGSKYVQSDTRGIYKLLKNDVVSGCEVLFFGTPCQVSAVKNIFKKNPDNLYAVDLICHGVPSQKMLDDQFALFGRKIGANSPKTVSFRSGTDFRLQMLYDNGQTYACRYWEAPYYRAFFDGFSYRPSCYRCPYASPKRKGDLTIGDFWGIENLSLLPAQALNGVSVVLVSTPKGRRLFDRISSCIEFQERPLREAVNGNDQLRAPVKETFRSKCFRHLYPMLPLDCVVTACVADKKFKTFLHLVAKKIKR